MKNPRYLPLLLALSSGYYAIAPARGQDVPGIEICTVEKTMQRRTSCLQSNIEFLQKTFGKAAAEAQQKLDAVSREIVALKAALAATQKRIDDIEAAQKAAKSAAPPTPAKPPAK